MRKIVYTSYPRLLYQSIKHYTMSAEQSNRLQLPGYNLPLNYRPDVSITTSPCIIKICMLEYNSRVSVYRVASLLGVRSFQMPWIMATLRVAGLSKTSHCILCHGQNLLTHVSRINVHREILMMRVMNTITDKPDWDKKVCISSCNAIYYSHDAGLR